jgi:hypothetical protein
LCILRLESGLESDRLPPGDLGGLEVLRPRENILKLPVAERGRSPPGGVVMGIVVVRPGDAISLRAKGSFDLGSIVSGEEGPLKLLSHETAEDADEYELKLCTLILSSAFSVRVNLSLILRRASRSTALSSSFRRMVDTGEEPADGGGEEFEHTELEESRPQ